MLKVLRDNLKYLSWVLWLVIAVFILFVFVDFGATVPTAGGDTDAAATVGGEKITYSQFQRAYQAQEDRLRQAYGEGFTRETARQMGLPLQVMNQLIAQRILDGEARRAGLRVTDEEVRRVILEEGAFRDSDGRFVGEEIYRQMLRRAGYTPESFERAVREDLLSEKLRTVLEQSVFVSDAEVERAYREQVESAAIRYLSLPASRYAEQVEITPAEVEAYFGEHREELRIPEKRQVSYLLVDPVALEATVEVSAADIRAYYDDNRDDYTQDEQVRARHILLRVSDEAAAGEVESRLRGIRQRIEAGEPFAELAAQLSDDPGSKTRGGDLGFFGRGQMIAAFEEAAFGAQPGELVGPLRTDFGYHLIEVLEKRPGGTRSLDEVRAEIRSRLAAERAASLAESKARELAQQARREQVATGAALAALAAGEAGIEQRTPPAFARDEAVPQIGRATAFTTTAFELAPGELSEPVRTGRGWAVLLLEAVEPPRLPELDEARARVEQEVRRGKQLAAAEAALAAERERLAAGEATLDQVAERLDLEVQESGPFGGDGRVGSLGRQPGLAAAALALDAGQLGGPLAVDQGVVLFEVAERQRFDAGEFAAARDQTRQQLEQERFAQLLSSLIESRREEMKVSFDPNFLANFQAES